MRAGITTAAGLALLAMTMAGGASAQPADKDPTPLAQRHDTVESAVATPAEDLNVKKTPIPVALQQAVASPYAMAGLQLCDDIAAEVLTLDESLGPDNDGPAPPDERTADDKRNATAAGALKIGVEAVEPFRGIVRWVSGADAADKKIQEAVDAGFARRGFLKGIALERNCPPPASPAWFVPAKTAQRPRAVPADVPQPPPAPARQAEAPTASLAPEQSALIPDPTPLPPVPAQN